MQRSLTFWAYLHSSKLYPLTCISTDHFIISTWNQIRKFGATIYTHKMKSQFTVNFIIYHYRSTAKKFNRQQITLNFWIRLIKWHFTFWHWTRYVPQCTWQCANHQETYIIVNCLFSCWPTRSVLNSPTDQTKDKKQHAMLRSDKMWLPSPQSWTVPSVFHFFAPIAKYLDEIFLYLDGPEVSIISPDISNTDQNRPVTRSF